MQVIDAAMARARTVILGLITILIAGVVAYVTIPKEAEPDIEIPIIYVYIQHDGISPEDAARWQNRSQRSRSQGRWIQGRGASDRRLRRPAALD